MSARNGAAPPKARKTQAKRKPKAPVAPEPFKIVGQLIGAIKNEDGEIVGEVQMGQVAIYKADFGNLEQKVAEVERRVSEVAEAEREIQDIRAGKA